MTRRIFFGDSVELEKFLLDAKHSAGSTSYEKPGSKDEDAASPRFAGGNGKDGHSRCPLLVSFE